MTARTLRSELSRLAFGNPLYPLTLGRVGPRRLELVPPDPWPGDAANGADIVNGRYRFAGQLIQANNPLWLPSGVGTDFIAALHGFEWLRDLRALSGDAARRQARFAVADWIARHDRWHELVWRPDVLGLRVASWLSAHDFFCASADDEFRHAMFASLARQVRHLARTLPGELEGADLLFALKGLVYGALCLLDDGQRLGPALKLLERELPRQILPDGGHVQRNPSLHLLVLRHLIDLRGLLRAAHVAGMEADVPVALQHAIDRMTPALRFYRHGDGGLCVFNGADESEPVLIDAVMAQADARGRPLRSARHSGFERVLLGRTLILMDAGEPPAPGLDTGAHAGTLSFELSVGRERVIVNCGSWPSAGSPKEAAWSLALRGTAAHSTLVVDDANSSAIVEGGGLRRRPGGVSVDRQEADGAVLIEASHDGYADRYGLIHHRRLYVTAGGDDVRGEDRLAGPGGTPFAIRFHLHPNVRLDPEQHEEGVLLTLGSGVAYRLHAAGVAMRIEESIYVGSGEAPQRAHQIVLFGATAAGGATVKWALKRERRD